MDLRGPLEDARDPDAAFEYGSLALAQAVEIFAIRQVAADRDAAVDGLLVRTIVRAVDYNRRWLAPAPAVHPQSPNLRVHLRDGALIVTILGRIRH